MSLSTQLTRGVLALPMLLGFASLALVANHRAGTERVVVPTLSISQAVAISQMAEAAEAAEAAEVARLARAAAIPALERLSTLCSSLGHGHVLMLAQAPADLGNLAIRWSHSCRA